MNLNNIDFVSRETVEAWETELDYRHLKTPELEPPVCRISQGQESSPPVFTVEPEQKTVIVE